MSPFDWLCASKGEEGLARPLESFVSTVLAEAGVWSSPRTSDGVASYRIVERNPAVARVSGHVPPARPARD